MEGDLIPWASPFPKSSFETYSKMSTYDIFYEFFESDVYEHLIQVTDKYAASNNLLIFFLYLSSV